MKVQTKMKTASPTRYVSIRRLLEVFVHMRLSDKYQNEPAILCSTLVDLKLTKRTKILLLFLKRNICCGCSK